VREVGIDLHFAKVCAKGLECYRLLRGLAHSDAAFAIDGKFPSPLKDVLKTVVLGGIVLGGEPIDARYRNLVGFETVQR